MRYKEITTIKGLRMVRSDYDEPLLEVELEEEGWCHLVKLPYNEWVGKLNLGDGITVTIEREESQ